MRPFLLKLLCFLPIPLIVMGVNYTVDPANLFSQGAYERTMARLVLQGRHVLTSADYDDRAFIKAYMDGATQAPEVLVIGSSRAKPIHADWFPNRTFFNQSVAGAGMQDYLAIYQLYRNKNFKPKLLIITADPWVFNKNNEIILKDTAYEREYYQALAALRLAPLPQDEPPTNALVPEAWWEIFSLSYFQQALQMGWLGAKPPNPIPEATDQTLHPEYNLKLNDGSLSRNERVRARKPVEVRALAMNDVNRKPLLRWDRFTELDSSALTMFEAFIQTVQQDNVEIVLLLAPYYPQVYEKLSTSPDYKLITAAEAYYRQFAREHQLTIIGSYNPAGLIADTEFYDGVHAKDDPLKRIFMQQWQK
jgi:hypothetical protein